ncbi:MAG: hypothetical protein NC180_10550 [Muribaculaceae bacterium]|nr:hypothetical protein [Muribaculaceae bacterium]MCM1560204.1 hypothetical protein [Butyrivibrio sp.]
MAGRKEVRKSITFRLNLDREEEKELYEAIRQHNRQVSGDVYGSAGAYIKTALRYYQKKESGARLQEQFQADMEEYLQKLASSEKEEFLKALEEHDQQLVSMVLEAVMPMLGKVSEAVPVSAETGFDERGQKKSRKENVFTNRKNSITDGSESMFPDSDESAGTEDMPEEALSYVLGL